MTKRQFILGLVAALASFATLVTAGQAMAEMIVIDSSASAYKAGMKLSDEAALDLAKGATLKLLRKSDGVTHSLNGPYKGTLKDYASRPRSMWEKIFGSKDPAGPPRGGVPVGGTRGARQPPPTGGTRGIIK